MVKRSSSSAEERWSSEQEQGDPSPAAEDQLFCSCETSQENHHWNDIPASTTARAAELAELFCSCKEVRDQGDGGRSQLLVVGLLGWRRPEPRNSVQEQGDPNPAQLVS